MALPSNGKNGNGAGGSTAEFRPRPYEYALQDYRHRTCGRLLFRGLLVYGTKIQIRCPKCGGMTVIEASEPSDTALIESEELEALNKV